MYAVLDRYLLQFSDWISTSLTALVLFPLLMMIVIREYAIHIFILFGIVSCHMLGKALKIMTYKINNDIFKRPQGARNCDVMCRDGDVSYKPGFPSGHMIHVTFFFTILYLLIVRAQKPSNQYYILFSIIYIALTAFARYYKKCHTTLQIVSGIFVGYISALAFALFWTQMINKR